MLVQNGADESTRVGRDAMSPVKALAAPMFSASSPLLKTPPKRLTGLTSIVCSVSFWAVFVCDSEWCIRG